MVSTEKRVEPSFEAKRDEETGKKEKAGVTNLDDRYSSVCPGCEGTLDFWACEALCHYCGLKFTCDE
tara:strand:- start:411 stop:611 length:201 start_codon:yes stop_codon:yes gene_type:complete